MLRYTLSLTAPSEPLTSRVVRVKVGQVDRDPVGLNVNDPPSLLVYVVDGLQHGENFWVSVEDTDLHGNIANSEAYHFVATDSFAPTPPTVTVTNVEQV
jgi:hypothetical protein